VAGEETQRIMSVPPLITLFLSRCLSLFCTAPESALHQPLSRFLLQRAVIDGKDVPMLYSLLYSSADLPSEGHLWLMQMLHDGLGTTLVSPATILTYSSAPRYIPSVWAYLSFGSLRIGKSWIIVRRSKSWSHLSIHLPPAQFPSLGICSSR
jgi:hypothetical protein